MLVGLVLTGIWPLFPDFVDKAGPPGVFLKLALAQPYFAIFNSRICDGQTFGKRWMDVQVVDQGGANNLVRQVDTPIFGLVRPYFIGLDVAGRATLAWPLSAIVAALAIIANGTFYLLIFNRQTRRGFMTSDSTSQGFLLEVAWGDLRFLGICRPAARPFSALTRRWQPTRTSVLPA